MSTDDKAFISGPITEPRLALTPQERAWVEELDEYGWSYGDIMLQRDEVRARAERAEAEAARLAADLLVQQRATDEAEAEVERMRRGEVDGIFTSVVHECCSRAQAAEVALDRVRAVIAPRTAHDCPSCGVLAREVEAAIEGQP